MEIKNDVTCKPNTVEFKLARKALRRHRAKNIASWGLALGGIALGMSQAFNGDGANGYLVATSFAAMGFGVKGVHDTQGPEPQLPPKNHSTTYKSKNVPV